MKLLHRTSHRARVTLISTVASAVVLAAVLVATSILLLKSTNQTAERELGFGARGIGRALEHRSPQELVDNLVHRSPQNTIAIYDSGGKLIAGGGAYKPPVALGEFSPPDSMRDFKFKSKEGRTVVLAADWTERLAELHRTDVALLFLWPALTAMIGLVTFWAVSSSFKPLDRLLVEAGKLELNDRLTVDDQAEFGRLATSINRYLDTIQAVVRQQEDFAVDAAHELCTPLTALRGQLEVALMKGNDYAKLSHAAEAAVAQVARLERLVEGLLLAARPHEGIVIGCDVQAVVEEAQARWVDRFSEKKVRLNAKAATPFQSAIAQEELESILDNLLSNALRFSPEGTTVRIEADASGELSVQDEGPGIAPENRDRIFDRFERGSGKGKGYGIGLYLARRLIEARRGAIKVGESSKGARIEVSLPLTA